MPLDLSSATAKFERAQTHAHELQRLVRLWLHDDSDPPIRPGFTDEPNHRRTLAYAKSLKDIPTTEWGKLFGDALNNYRSALNHVVGAMVLRGKKAEEFANLASVFQFPVCRGTREQLLDPGGHIRRVQLPGVRRRDVEAISPFQPYKGRAHRWELPALKSLNDIDKHRRAVLAVHHVAGLVTVQPIPALVRHQSLRPRGPTQPDTKLAYLNWIGERPEIIDVGRPFTKHSKPDVTVRFDASATVVLEDLSPAIRPLIETLDAIESLVDEVMGKGRGL